MRSAEALYEPAADRSDCPSARKLEQHDVGMLLHLFDHQFTPVRRDVEITELELRAEVRELPFRSGIEIDRP